ncbi:LacI family DNA-binding transcriptional regulator [Labrenzia sp. 011]|uniref:LacI family DNA-binding transcriptional regulator n=1 Tax=Labrenzia sp. 011 TaxID=2171494 RepID=UPI000D5220CC|nr:LacI family DNA-binding transcriptional regulator [Labrenzia sp. 011]PVB61409.1 LacI family transcriptional regulator [Labrenzia sp. 011]
MNQTPKKQVNSFDVARLAGVSRSAVSRTFTDGASVSKETREKVMAAARQLGYRVNVLARSLHKQKSDLVGVVAADLDNPFRSEQIDLLSQGLLELGFRPILLRGEPSENVAELIGSLLQYSVAGVIVTSDTPPEEICQECLQNGVPLVVVNKRDPGAPVDRVVTDFEAGGRLALDHLLDCGCGKLAVVTPERSSYSVLGRAQSFEQAANARGVPVIRIAWGTQSYEGGLSAADFAYRVRSEVDGIFCAADYLALGVLDGLRHVHGVNVPKDMQVIGYDDIPQASWKAYDLTTVSQSRRDLCEATLDLLMRRLEEPEASPQIRTCGVSLVRRGTTRHRS